jgi:DNA-binding response OmpR family regulator
MNSNTQTWRTAVAAGCGVLVASRTKTLLLVDDDSSQLAMRKVVLEHLGYAVLTAPDARCGMRLLQRVRPDAVVLDYEMPAINGDVLAAKIRRADGGIPIIMLSGSPSLPSSALAAVDAFVPKAAETSLLIGAIESLTRVQQEVFV